MVSADGTGIVSQAGGLLLTRACRVTGLDRDLAGDTAPGADGGLVTVDIDATIVTSCSEKEQAMPTWKKTYGLLTELPGLSLQFRRRVVCGAVTVPDHGRIR